MPTLSHPSAGPAAAAAAAAYTPVTAEEVNQPASFPDLPGYRQELCDPIPNRHKNYGPLYKVWKHPLFQHIPRDTNDNEPDGYVMFQRADEDAQTAFYYWAQTLPVRDDSDCQSDAQYAALTGLVQLMPGESQLFISLNFICSPFFAGQFVCLRQPGGHPMQDIIEAWTPPPGLLSQQALDAVKAVKEKMLGDELKRTNMGPKYVKKEMTGGIAFERDVHKRLEATKQGPRCFGAGLTEQPYLGHVVQPAANVGRHKDPEMMPEYLKVFSPFNHA